MEKPCLFGKKKADSQIHADCFFFCSTIDLKGKKKSYMELRTFLKKKKTFYATA